jgi:acetyl-CoA synthetase
MAKDQDGAPPSPEEIVEAAHSESDIAVHWKEEDYYPPPGDFVKEANANDPDMLENWTPEKFPDCFVDYAEMLTWDKKWDQVLDTSNPPFFKWWVGGKLNACVNCVDRHLEERGDQNAIIWVPELEEDETEEITYKQLHKRVNAFAALLKDFAGLEKGDRVTFHLPMIPDLPVSMLAAARLGVIHSEVFGGFSGTACGQRMADADSTVLVTTDAYYRSGELVDHKVKADEAIEAAKKEGIEVDKVLVWRRKPGEYHSESEMVEGRDYFVDELLEKYEDQEVDPVSLDATDTLFLMYTSGTTGRPKGAQHSVGGYMSYVTGTSKYYQDIHPEDTYWCFADIGWITGHSYIVYGPLALGTTTVMYEGTPTYPDPGRPWRIAEKLGVNIFHTAPTTIRMLRKVGPDEPAKHDYHFKTMTTVGEPIEPDVWRWYYEVVGKEKAAITDTWWMTETGGFLGSTLPGLQPMKPGSCGPAALGIQLAIYDEQGNEIEKGAEKAGYICVRNPWPGRMLTVWGQDERFIDTYYKKLNTDENSKDWKDWPFVCGDGALQAEDGYFRILGRMDDVINVAGHRLGTKELESAAIEVEEVAEAAAVPVIDEVRGKVVEMYVALKPGHDAGKEIADKVKSTIEKDIGKIARPKNVWIVPDMPKTRSGKIMRRVIASISNFQDVGDVSTLANPDVVEEIKDYVQKEKKEKDDVPTDLSEKEKEEIATYGEKSE